MDHDAFLAIIFIACFIASFVATTLIINRIRW